MQSGAVFLRDSSSAMVLVAPLTVERRAPRSAGRKARLVMRASFAKVRPTGNATDDPWRFNEDVEDEHRPAKISLMLGLESPLSFKRNPGARRETRTEHYGLATISILARIS